MDKRIIKVRCNDGTTTTLEADGSWTVLRLKHALSQKLSDIDLQIDSQRIGVIFAGQALNNNQSIRECQISTFSVVHAILRSQDDENEGVRVDKNCNLNNYYPATGLPIEEAMIMKAIDKNSDPSHNISSRFYVYCKRCGTVTPGKLRVRCSKCKESSVTLVRGPESWDDILIYGRIKGTCQFECSNTIVEFYFKCGSHLTDENEFSAPLYQIRTNTRAVPCLICYEQRDVVLVFSCESGHTLCLNCFRELCLTKMNDRQFDFVEGIGYTIPCPVGCEGSHIKDCHHFRILGKKNYERYHKFGAEELTLSLGGVLCPGPNCGQGILYDGDDNCIECPDKIGCGLIFCRRCLKVWHEGSCETYEISDNCHNYTQPYRINAADADKARWERKTKETIKKISKPCPKCNTPIQKSGGCMHMSCPIPRCRFQWCWICCKEWNSNCRDDHWFGL